MSKAQWIKKLEKIEREDGIDSPKYQTEYLKHCEKYETTGRGLDISTDHTNGKKKRNIKLPFGLGRKNANDA